MNVQPKLALVMSSRQLLVAQVAVALCSGIDEQWLDDWEEFRVCVGEEFDALAVRLEGARALAESSGAEVVPLLDCNGRPMVAVELVLCEDEVWVLQVAVERLRGILARTGEFNGQFDDDLDCVVGALV